jgi:signal peptidase I
VVSPVARLRSAAHLTFQFALLVALAFAIVGLRPGQVSGFSMTPRIDEDEYVLINALAYRLTTPQRGDIVAFKHERSAPSVYLKRIIGVPGDRVKIERGAVSINGRQLTEPYVRFHDDRSAPESIVPRGAYYVLGDNRKNSDDSRAWGTVPAGDLIGRAVIGVWPIDHVGLLR